MIVTKPIQLRVDLDPDAGFPVSMQLVSRRIIIEDDREVMELSPETTTLAPGSDAAEQLLGTVTTNAICVLATYQNEVQRLASLLEQSSQAQAPVAVELVGPS